MKIIFLDFDGVLNNEAWMKQLTEKGRTFRSYSDRDMDELDPARVKMISDLVLETDSHIVISSSWRLLNDLEMLNYVLVTNGLDPKAQAIALTPETQKGFRGDEVALWLAKNPQVVNYVIFDDGIDFYEIQKDRLMLTTWDEGLTEQHVEKARKILLNID